MSKQILGSGTRNKPLGIFCNYNEWELTKCKQILGYIVAMLVAIGSDTMNIDFENMVKNAENVTGQITKLWESIIKAKLEMIVKIELTNQERKYARRVLKDLDDVVSFAFICYRQCLYNLNKKCWPTNENISEFLENSASPDKKYVLNAFSTTLDRLILARGKITDFDKNDYPVSDDEIEAFIRIVIEASDSNDPDKGIIKNSIRYVRLKFFDTLLGFDVRGCINRLRQEQKVVIVNGDIRSRINVNKNKFTYIGFKIWQCKS